MTSPDAENSNKAVIPVPPKACYIWHAIECLFFVSQSTPNSQSVDVARQGSLIGAGASSVLSWQNNAFNTILRFNVLFFEQWFFSRAIHANHRTSLRQSSFCRSESHSATYIILLYAIAAWVRRARCIFFFSAARVCQSSSQLFIGSLSQTLCLIGSLSGSLSHDTSLDRLAVG